jgi:hypothetical protein
MAFYVVRNQSNGAYLSMQEGDTWVDDVRCAAIFTLRSTAAHSIRRAWQGVCEVERIERLPDRIVHRRAVRSRRLVKPFSMELKPLA